MAIATDDIDRTGLKLCYSAARLVVERTLQASDSLFTPGRPIWSMTNIQDLYDRVVGHPNLSAHSFGAKFAPQLNGAPAATIQLAGELLFVHCLFPADMSGPDKRALINEVLSWSPSPVTVPEQLAETLDDGLAVAGKAYMIRRPMQLWFMLDFYRLWKQLDDAEHARLLRDPWAFKAWVWAWVWDVPLQGAQSQREALLHIVHPGTFEAIASRDHKLRIANAFKSRLVGAHSDVDRQLLEIRQGLTAEAGHPIDFYSEPLRAKWLDDQPSQPPPPPAQPPQPIRVLLQSDDALAERLLFPKEWLAETIELLDEKRQVVFYGPPGTGKTWTAMRLATYLTQAGGEVLLVQLHPSYAYEDFVEGYRPQAGANGPTVQFELVPGPLRQLADLARADPTHPYILIVDEINRGNLAKVLGELYFLLEYRDQSVALQYSPSTTFTLPDNLFVIGTMNTADRSIALIDAAMRRRFYYIPFLPNEEPIQGLLRRWLERRGLDETPADLLDELNRRIDDPEAAIGPSYLMSQSAVTPIGLKRVWRHAIMPQLAEQYYGHSIDIEQRFGYESLLRAVTARPDADGKSASDSALG